jgi:hypothetical protein
MKTLNFFSLRVVAILLSMASAAPAWEEGVGPGKSSITGEEGIGPGRIALINEVLGDGWQNWWSIQPQEERTVIGWINGDWVQVEFDPISGIHVLDTVEIDWTAISGLLHQYNPILDQTRVTVIENGLISPDVFLVPGPSSRSRLSVPETEFKNPTDVPVLELFENDVWTLTPTVEPGPGF